MDQLTFLLEERPASHSRSRDSAVDWMTTVATWHSSFLGLLTERGPSGWYGRTFPASCRRTEDGILVPYSEGWSNSGMGSPTEFLTHNMSESTATLGPSPSDGGVCSLSDILETGDVPQRYYLSAKACRGILRRAEKRGKDLPPQLARALQAVRGRDGSHQLEARNDGTSNAILTPNGGRAGIGVGAVAFAENSRAELRLCGGDGGVAAQLTTGGGKPGQGQPCVADQWAVRRLTPTECERLQGFPDGYTAVTYRGKPAADGPRYKALGNSMAVNVMRWIGMRIQIVEGME